MNSGAHMSEGDKSLIDSLHKGSETAFHEIFTAYYAPLCEYASLYVSDGDAEEVVQAFMVHLWEGRENLCVENSLKSYLFVAVRNRCFNAIRDKRYRHVDRRLKRILRAEFAEGTSEVIEEAARQLDEFFARKRREFNVPLLFVGTDFQKIVWNELLTIPFGKTISYGEMAQRIGMPSAVRAVANANGANSMSIFAPCHRIIGSDRSLTGYGGGLPAKKFLLELESGVRLPL